MRIKKEIKVIIILFLLVIPLIFLRKVFIRKYDILYEKNKYIINEIYEYKNKEHLYEINIKNNKQEITYLLNNDFNKNKKIIKNLKVYKDDNITCLLPIYNQKIEYKLYCLKDDIQVSDYYLKDNESYKKILKKVKKYKINNFIENNKTTSYKKLKVYDNNISSEDIFTIWDYKGISIIEKDKTNYIKFLDYDLYDNIKTIIYDKYFVLFENNHVDGIKNIHYYDLEKDKLKIYNPEIIISKDFYINGVVDNLIYVTDNKTKKEYTIDLKKEEIIQINKANEYLTYYDNEFKSLTKSDYFMEKQIFNNKKVIDKKISNEEHIKENNIYYFYEDNNFYRQRTNRNKELLFSIDEIKEWKIISNKIIFISEDILYLYDDNRGLVPIIQSNELNYNYENICDYKEKK
ncbi:MAG: hypothetical protein IJ399_05135 [Bacilli bacterium]|nr:hypothetical protein [Bacilli bacterium]MBQ8534770.1 hypothetical protein [Bacilli bacterium]